TKTTDSNEAVWLKSDAGTERQLTTGSSLYLKMQDADGAVLKTGNQTVAGVKWFSTPPETDANAVDANDLTRKAYVDGECDSHQAAAVAEAVADPNLHFGTWTNKDSENNTLAEGSTYQATSDGFVLGWTDYSPCHLYSDGSSPPTTTRWHSTGIGVRACCVPIRKDDYWKTTGFPGTIYWLPIGAGECEKQP
ncbi:MAG: hypothetical protein OEV33_00075, partial [Armatimonadota bacterium]|nr:hypothetical protein [Armatimonadota bacterium]